MNSYPPVIVPSTAQLREFEKSWIQKCDPQWGLVLMEQAGSAAAQVVHNLWLQARGLVVVVCGTGNNGGDGMVVARYLHNRSIPVAVHYIESNTAGLQSSHQEAAVNLSVAQKDDIPMSKIVKEDLGSVRESLGSASVIVDALLGTGLDRPVEGLYEQLIEMINRCGRPVVAIDVPSGVNSDNGQIMGTAIRAVATVTFAYLKPGLLAFPGAGLCGHLCVADIGLPPIEQQADNHSVSSYIAEQEAKEKSTEGQDPRSSFPFASYSDQLVEQLKKMTPRTMLSTLEFARSALPPRYVDSHKGSYGTVVTIAGSAEMSGAAELSSVGALRAGAGLSILAGAEAVVQKLGAPEVICHVLPSTNAGTISKKALEQLEEVIEKGDAVVLGPGLSQNEETVELVHEFVNSVLSKARKPCVVDADALTAIAKNPACLSSGTEAGHLVFTPHPGELSRLLGTDIKSIQSDRYKAVRTAAAKFECTVLLKGSRTLVANHAGDVFINSTGNPAMSTAGAGDVLAGVIGAFLAQGVGAFEAAALGAYVHGAAGDIAAFNVGDVGILAGDIAQFVPTAINKIRTGEYPGSSLEVQLVTEPFVPRPR